MNLNESKEGTYGVFGRRKEKKRMMYLFYNLKNKRSKYMEESTLRPLLSPWRFLRGERSPMLGLSRCLAPCTGYFSVAVIKRQDQRQFIDELVSDYGSSRLRVYSFVTKQRPKVGGWTVGVIYGEHVWMAERIPKWVVAWSAVERKVWSRIAMSR